MTLNELIKKHGFDKINSLTEYPSILTYHKLGEKGGLKNELIDKAPDGEVLEITEKVDGTNGRCIILNGDYLIGARNTFVYAKGDRVVNSNIVGVIEKALGDYFDKADYDMLTCIYGETYGHRIQDGSKIYCVDGCQDIDYRVFDVWTMSVNQADELLSQDQAAITRWREENNQPWFDVNQLAEFVLHNRLKRTHVRMTMCSNDLPIDVEDTMAWMSNFSKSYAIIGKEGATGSNQKFARAEGIVIRNKNRSFIRKLRFEDYEKGKRKGWV